MEKCAAPAGCDLALGLAAVGVPKNVAARLVRAHGLGWRPSGLASGVALLDQAPTARRVPSIHRDYAHFRDRCPLGRTTGSGSPGLGWAGHTRSASAGEAGAGIDEPSEEPDEEIAVGTIARDTALLVEQRGRLIAAIELISPRNKDRPAACTAYTSAYAAYLLRGVHLLLVDVHRRPVSFSFADRIARELELEQPPCPAPFAVAYRVGEPARAAVGSSPSGAGTWRWAQFCRRCGCRCQSASRCQSISRQHIGAHRGGLSKLSTSALSRLSFEDQPA